MTRLESDRSGDERRLSASSPDILPSPAPLAADETEVLRAFDERMAGALTRAMFEQSPLSVLIAEPDGRPRLANPAFGRLWGITLDRMAADYRVTQDPQLERLGVLPLVRRAFRGEAITIPPICYDAAQLAGEGRSRWVECHLLPVRDLEDRVTAVMLLQADLTARIDAEQAMRSAEERLRLATDAAELGTWEWEIATERVRWSATLERIHGLSTGTFGGTFADYKHDIHPDDRSAVLETIRATLAGQEHRLRYRIIRPDGEVRWLEARGRLQHEDGTVRRLLGVCSDVTEFVREEERARFLASASEILHGSLAYERTLQRLARVAVPSIADWCIVRLAAQGGAPARTIVAHRDPVQEIALRELVERYPLHPDSEAHPAAIVLRSGESRLAHDRSDRELALIARDAGHLALLRRFRARSYVLVPLVSRGDVYGTLSLSADEARGPYDARDVALAEEIARRAGAAMDNALLHEEADQAREHREQQAVELEQQTQQLHEQAVEVEAQKEELEILNIELARSNAELAAELARRTALATDNARLYRAAIEAQQEAELANRAKSDFLAVMSHELRTPLNAIGGYAQLLEMEVHGPVNPAQRESLERLQRSQRHLLSLINDVLNFAKLEAGRVQYHLEPLDVAATLAGMEALVGPQLAASDIRYAYEPPPSPVSARGDAEKVQQILLNLLSNAIKFTPSGGRIAVRTHADADRVHVSVTDTGEGIPRDKRDAVFEPFVQLARERRPVQEGTGLGLAISRDLARAMGGDVTLSSNEGERGSVFTLTLPRG